LAKTAQGKLAVEMSDHTKWILEVGVAAICIIGAFMAFNAVIQRGQSNGWVS
jgi:hypothetical protein